MGIGTFIANTLKSIKNWFLDEPRVASSNVDAKTQACEQSEQHKEPCATSNNVDAKTQACEKIEETKRSAQCKTDTDFYINAIWVTRGNRQNVIKTLRVGDTLRFILEGNNSNDENVILIVTESGKDVGGVSKVYSQDILQKIKSGVVYKLIVSNITRKKREDTLGVKIKVSVLQGSTNENISSFEMHYSRRSSFPNNFSETNKEGFINPQYYPIEITRHAKERLQDRLEIKYDRDMYEHIKLVYKDGQSRYQVDEDVAQKMQNIESRDKDCIALLYNGYVYIFSKYNRLITVYNLTAFDKFGYDKNGYDRYGYNKCGFDQDGWHRNGTFFDNDGFSDDGYDEKGLDKKGLKVNLDKFTRKYYRDGYDVQGYDYNGFDKRGFDKNGKHRNGTKFDNDGYTIDGYNRCGFNKDGYNKKGFDKNGIHKNGTRFDENGYDFEGYDKEGYSKWGYDRDKRDRNGNWFYL